MKIQVLKNIIIAIALVNTFQAMSQDNKTNQNTNFADSVNLYPVTVIGVHHNRNSEQVAIKQSDKIAHDAATLLRQSPLVNSIQKGGAYGFDPVIRGFKYDQINIILDGAQSAIAACPNRMDPPTSQMAPNMLNRIEIIKGPYGLRYGNAIGATVHFKQLPLYFTQQQTIAGRVSAQYDSNSNAYRTEMMSGVQNSKINWKVFGALSSGDDYKDAKGNAIKSAYERNSFGSNLGLKLTNNQTLSLSVTRNYAKNTHFASLPMDLRKDDTWLFNAKHSILFYKNNLKEWNTVAYGTFVDHVMDNRLKVIEPRKMDAETFAKTQNSGFRTEGIWKLGSSTLYTGADFRYEFASGERNRIMLMGAMKGNVMTDNVWQDASILKTNVFGEFNTSMNNWKYVAALRLGLNQSVANDPDALFEKVHTENSATQINPSISFGAMRQLSNVWNLSLWAARVQRSGSLTERFINFFPVGLDPFELIGNPSLNPEVNHQLDIVLKRKTDRSIVQFTIFGAYLSNFISSVKDANINPRLANSAGVRRFININEVLKSGFELEWDTYLGAGIAQNVQLAYTFAEKADDKTPIPEIAPMDMRYSLHGSYLKGKLFPELMLRHVLAQDRVSSAFGEQTTPSFTTLDLSIRFAPFEQLSIKAGVNNLLNTYYYEHLSRSIKASGNPFYAAGRNAFISTVFTF